MHHFLIQRLTADDGGESAIRTEALLVAPSGSAIYFSEHAALFCSLTAIGAARFFRVFRAILRLREISVQFLPAQ
jgi:hypothetical protein